VILVAVQLLGGCGVDDDFDFVFAAAVDESGR
jgi:hypothetical protein